jgi:hypothetical protein
MYDFTKKKLTMADLRKLLANGKLFLLFSKLSPLHIQKQPFFRILPHPHEISILLSFFLSVFLSRLFYCIPLLFLIWGKEYILLRWKFV